MKIVKVTFPPKDWDIAKYSPDGSCVWKDYHFIVNQEIKECDYWIVCGNLIDEFESTIVSPQNIIFDTSESKDVVNYSKSFLNQFNFISTFRTDISHSRLIKSPPVIPWFLKKSFDELKVLKNIDKTKKISLLASNKRVSINHIKRLDFVKKLYKHFGNEIDFYGAGFTPHINDKTPTLEPYMFSIILETITENEYLSEKLGDSLLSLSFPIYYGCKNLNEFLNPSSFVEININDFSTTVTTIKAILNSEKFYDDHLQALVTAKDLYLNNLSIFPVMANILDKVAERNKNIESLKKQEIRISRFQQAYTLAFVSNKLKTGAYDAVTRFF